MPVRPARAATGLSVVATTGMIADAASTILGDLGEVRALMGPGVDPHAFRQTRSDIVAMTRADLTLYHGLYLEAQMEEFLQNLARRRAVVPVADGLGRDRLLSHPDYDGKFDPHVWMVPDIWTDVVAAISAALIDAAPEGEAALAARTDAYQAQVKALQDYAETVLSTVPEEARVLVTAHDAFSYFGRAYGFEVLGIQGISTESEAGGPGGRGGGPMSSGSMFISGGSGCPISTGGGGPISTGSMRISGGSGGPISTGIGCPMSATGCGVPKSSSGFGISSGFGVPMSNIHSSPWSLPSSPGIVTMLSPHALAASATRSTSESEIREPSSLCGSTMKISSQRSLPRVAKSRSFLIRTPIKGSSLASFSSVRPARINAPIQSMSSLVEGFFRRLS